MAGLAERDEVVEHVGSLMFPVEVSAGNQVMHVKAGPLLMKPAILTRMFIALAGSAGLIVPVRSVVGLSPAAKASVLLGVLANVGVPARGAAKALLLRPVRIAAVEGEGLAAMQADERGGWLLASKDRPPHFGSREFRAMFGRLGAALRLGRDAWTLAGIGAIQVRFGWISEV